MASDKNNFYLQPYEVKRITFNETRILEYMSMSVSGILKKWHKKSTVWVIVETNVGKISVKTKTNAQNFLGWMLVNAPAWKERNLDSWFK